MRVDIDISVFVDEPHWCLPLLWFAYVGRHRVLPASNAEAAYDSWREALASPRLQQVVTFAVNGSVTASVREPAHHRVSVSTKGDKSSYSPADAWQLLQRPYRVLVEDAFNDRAFLLRMCPVEDRAWLASRLDAEWLEFDHGGGISSMPRRVYELADRSRIPLLSCLFDSDSDVPDELSEQAVELRAACSAGDIHHYVLRRRAIENYLPRSALERWAGLPDRVPAQRQRRALVRKFCAAPERHHLNAKKHLTGGGLGQLYSREDAMNDHDVAAEGGPAELAPFVREVIRRAR